MMRVVLGILLTCAAALAGCGDDQGDAGRPAIVVTTTILGDIVREVVGGSADVEVVMPAGADPHEFAASARQVEAMTEADLLVINGAGFEESLQSAIDAAAEAGVEVFTAADHVELRRLEGADDPHLWTDPARMVAVVEALADAWPGADDAYAGDLRALDADIESLLAPIPGERRVLVTNHEVLGYFAERYGFEVVGTVIPSLTTSAEASSAGIEALAEVIRQEQVPAVFAETSSSSELAEALADEVGDVEVVELYSESLGEPGSGADTYLGMQRTNAERIAEALA